MSNVWNTTILTSEAEAIQVLTDLRGKRWLCRGQSRRYGGLVPSIDRGSLQNLSRREKLTLERQSIDIFRSTARFFADQGEQNALTDDIVALMVLRHYGVPTRLLDWSKSPYVAAYFAVQDRDTDDGEIWSFDEPLYEDEKKGPGPQQWKKWPETTSDSSGDGLKFSAELTAFTVEEPPDWFICGFYPLGFPRQNAQAGAYSMTARFERDHAEAIASLLGERSHYHLYVVSATLKPALRKLLRRVTVSGVGRSFPILLGLLKPRARSSQVISSNWN
ncbi:MAG TPA: FRG domain-containing protein [Blastocatellia bacterium]|nr:FRG domain-containing protein [Blastocatellia bacterium]